MTSEGKQSFISPYNKGHKLFIIPKLHTQQNIFFKLIYHFIHVYLFMLMVTLQRATTLCVLPVGVAMGARSSGIHVVYFPGAHSLGIHEVLSS